MDGFAAMRDSSARRRLDAVAGQLSRVSPSLALASMVSASPVSASPATNQRLILIANRGEIACRVARAVTAFGARSAAVFTPVDKDSRFVGEASEAHAIGSYTDGQAIADLAGRLGVTAVHPGYGFLSEDGEFAARVKSTGAVWIGPDPEIIALFGDKVAAKRLAEKAGVPIALGSPAFSDLAALKSWMNSVPEEKRPSFPLLCKATNGGGGRGIRAVDRAEDLDSIFSQTLREAALFTNAPTVFVEELITHPKHLEVQFLGDAQGNIRIVGDPRDCSIQHRRQKIIEFTPPVDLHPELADRINNYSIRLLKSLDKPYVGAGTVEFLISGSISSPSARAVFTELNPRIQVEHTVSEMTTGIDLVLAQLRLCIDGASVDDIKPSSVPPPGTAIQARITLHPSTTPLSLLSEYSEPSGPGIRIDSGLKKGMKISTDYDPLLLKLIVWTSDLAKPEVPPEERRQGIDKPATTFEAARLKLLDALEGLVVRGDGIRTNVGYLKQLLTVEEFKNGDARTTLLEDGGMEEVLWLLSGDAVDVESVPAIESEDAAVGEVLQVRSPVSGTVVASNLESGRAVRKGEPLLTLTSMKMESFVSAPADGYVDSAVDGVGEVGKIVKVGELVCSFRPAVLDESVLGSVANKPPENWEDEFAEIDARRQFAQGMGGPKAVAAQNSQGRLTLRQRIGLLLDPGTFFEFGKMAGQPVKDENGKVVDVVPGNFILGTGEVNGRMVVCGGEDFTIQGGSPNLAGLRKSVYTETLALELQCPLIRMHEGGGGSVGGADNRDRRNQGPQYRSPPSAAYETPRFLSVAQCLTRVPVLSAAMGSVAGMPASRLAASHFTVLVANGNAQIITAGPKVVERALGYSVTKQELGGPEMHDVSGVVDNFAESEEDAIRQMRIFLSYLPQNIFELPPVVQPPAERTEAELAQLNTLVPKSRRQTFEMRRALELVFDRDSFFEIGTTKFGQTLITGFARIGGFPVAVFANDCKFLAGAMTAQAAMKVTRLIELAHTFRLPIVTFVDEVGNEDGEARVNNGADSSVKPGFDIGLDAERAGTIRYGTKAVLTAQSSKVPWATVLVRKLYGVAGAAHLAPGYKIAWPSFESGALPLESGVAVAFGKQIAAAADPAKARAEFEARFSKGLSPFPAAETFAQHELVKPAETREYLMAWIKRSWPLLSRLDPVATGSFGFRG